jgi:hypothetical protein
MFDVETLWTDFAQRIVTPDDYVNSLIDERLFHG